MNNFFIHLEPVHPSCLIKLLTNDKLPRKTIIWEFTNEIKPVDMYCYLYTKYGRPNGLQNFLRSDSSDNLIHWEWSFASDFGILSIQGQNFRTEVHLIGEYEDQNLTLDMFIQEIKSDLKNHGKAMKKIRNQLEKWTRFINPYHRINSVVSKNIKSLIELEINIDKDRELIKKSETDFHDMKEKLELIGDKYDNAISLTFGLRSMYPVLAESFINLILFILSKPEIKGNDRLFQSVIRQQIDIRVQTLHLNCIGFIKPIDYANDICKKFHTLMNERNDLLHGNVEVSKLKIGDVYFNGKVPVFIDYEDFWQKTRGISLGSVRYNTIRDDHAVVTDFIDFILSHISNELKEQIEFIMTNSELGYNSESGRLGALFSKDIVDFRLRTNEA